MGLDIAQATAADAEVIATILGEVEEYYGGELIAPPVADVAAALFEGSPPPGYCSHARATRSSDSPQSADCGRQPARTPACTSRNSSSARRHVAEEWPGR